VQFRLVADADKDSASGLPIIQKVRDAALRGYRDGLPRAAGL
jgi:hypothetical protein